MTKKAHCPYCGLVDDMPVAETGCYSDGKPKKIYSLKCRRCGRVFWQKEETK